MTGLPCDRGSGSGERSAGDDALAGSGDGGSQAGFGLRLRPSGGVGEPSTGVVRKMLQHGFLDDWTYSVRTLQDNVSLVTPALLQELNALLVREGHAVAGKFPGAALDGRVDSFVVETDVHYSTDVNLLWDAMRVLLTEVSVCCGSHGVSGWRHRGGTGGARFGRAING